MGTSSSAALPTLRVMPTAWPDGCPLAPPIGCTSTDPGRSPALTWSGAPQGTRSYAVTITDPDAHGFLHWAVFGIRASVTSLPAGASPGGALPEGAHELTNGFGKPGYGGPCPPAGARHHYVLTVWALRDETSTVGDLRRDAVAARTLTATYAR